MDHSIKKLPKSEIQLTITVSEEILTVARKKAYEDISKEVKIKGFRPGHIPANILEQHIDKTYLDAHAKELAIRRSYAETVHKEKLQVISRPKVDISSDNPLTYTATVAVLPEVELKDHQSIKIKKEEPKVTDQDISKVLEDMQKHSTIYKDVEREVQKGDRVEVDFEGFEKDGTTVANTKSSNHPVIIGEGTLIPGFEDQLIGLKKAEKKEFEIIFPEDYHKKDFQKKEVTFKTEVKRVEEPERPDITEELIEKLTGKKHTIEEFKKEIETQILAKKTTEERQKQEGQYMEELLKKLEVELPDALIDEEVDFIVQDIKEDIGQKGHEFTRFLEQAKTTEEDLRKKYRPEAERRIKIRLALQHVIKEEKIEVTEEEALKELEKTKALYPAKESPKIQQEYDSGQLKNQLKNRLLLEKLFNHVLK